MSEALIIIVLATVLVIAARSPIRSHEAAKPHVSSFAVRTKTGDEDPVYEWNDTDWGGSR
jgi:hypothetical protein